MKSTLQQRLARLAPFLALTLLPAALLAQEPVTLSGSVVDAESAQPLPGVRIEIAEIGRSAITDSAGEFEIGRVRPGTYRARIRHLGYRETVESWVVTSDELPRRITLVPDPVVLEGITAQVDRLEQRRRSTTVSVRAFAGEDLQRSAAFDARDFLFTRGGLFRAACPGGFGSFGDDCIRWRGRVIRPSVYIDERPAFGLDELAAYPARELYALEVYDGGRHVRAYTVWFMERAARTARTLDPVVMWW